MYDDHFKIIFFKYVSVYYISEGHLVQPLAAAVGYAVTERIISLFGNGHCDALQPAEEKGYIFLKKFLLIRNICQKTFPLESSTA